MPGSTTALRARLRVGSGMPRDVWILTLNAFCVAVGFGVMMPVLPEFAKQFGVSNTLIGLVVSSFAFMRMVTSPFCGKLIDWMGVRAALGVGVFSVALSSAAAGFAHTFWELVVYRAVGGVGSALFNVAAMTMLIRAVDISYRGRASGFYQGGFLVGGMAGPALGGIVSQISLAAPFFFYALTLVIGGVLCLVFIRMPRHPTADPLADKPQGRTLREVIGDVRYQAACLMTFAVGWQSFGVRSTLVPIYVTTTLAMGRQWTGYALAIAAVAQTLALLPFGKLTDTWGRRPVMIIGGLTCAASALAMPFSPTIWFLVLALSAYGVGSAMLGTAPTAAVGDAVGPRGGTPIAVFSMTTDVGVIIGPLVAGFLSDHYGMGSAFAVGAAMLAGAALYATRMPRGFQVRPVASDDAQELQSSEEAEEHL